MPRNQRRGKGRQQNGNALAALLGGGGGGGGCCGSGPCCEPEQKPMPKFVEKPKPQGGGCSRPNDACCGPPVSKQKPTNKVQEAGCGNPDAGCCPSEAPKPKPQKKSGCTPGDGCCPPEEEPKTAKEKTQDYIDHQQKMHMQFIERFQQEELSLSIDPEVEAKKEVWAKREADEVKKLDKLIKKERNDFEDISGTGATNVKQVHDRIVKTLNQVRKINNQYYQIQQRSEDYAKVTSEKEKAVEASLKKKKLLSDMCDAFMKKMADLYLQHELMLEDENGQRTQIAEKFQKKMNGLSIELHDRKQERQKKFDTNQEVRDKIQKAIDDYKVKEEDYKKKMEVFNDEIGDVQKNLQTELATGSTGKVMKENQKEKENFEKIMTRMKKTSDEIQTFVTKFDSVKDEIEENNKKFGQFKMEVESKKLQMQLLETEIQNIQVKNQLKEKTEQDIKDQRAQMQKQIETLSGLNSALEVQLKAL